MQELDPLTIHDHLVIDDLDHRRFQSRLRHLDEVIAGANQRSGDIGADNALDGGQHRLSQLL